MTGWRSELASSETNVSNLAIQSISTEGVWGVAVISDAADLVACRLNRNEVVRAARIENRQQLEHAQRLMGINVCCIHPSGKTFIEMRNLLNAFGSIRPVVPANW
ncbi:MAG: hypothetical protein FJ267_05285 [Planctomycetes bacterium]|nr:hypothetical protein [Planctomycetota bacterium]